MKKREGRNQKLIGEKAFTLIELLISIIVLAVVMSSIIPLFVASISANKDSRNKLSAYQAANAEIENMRNTPFANIVTHSFTVSGVSSASGNATITDVIDGLPQTGILKGTFTVSWPNKGRTENITLITYFAQKGINQ